jgi:hypothetical protein
MGFVPHPPMPVGTLRPHDIVLLLAMGALYEFVTRIILLAARRRPESIRKRQRALHVLELRVRRSRELGPPAFVETSKLERQQLAEEKALSESAESRARTLMRYERLVRNAGTALSVIVFILWYGVPVLEFSGDRIVTLSQADRILSEGEGQEAAIAAFEACLFPMSYMGLGLKVSKWGMVNPRASSGALLVLWSAQTTVGKIMEGVEALLI